MVGKIIWTDPAMNVGMGGTVTTTSTKHLFPVPPPIVIQTQIDVALIKYILQRTVSNYDELVTQFNSIEDIKEAEQWDK